MIPAPYRLYAALGVGALIVALVAGLLFTRARLDAEKQGRLADRQAVATAQAEARAADLQHARDVEAAQTRIKEEVTRDLEGKLAAARAAADDYARRLRNQAAQGGGDRADMSFTPATAVAADGAGSQTILDDLRACGDAVVKAEGWRDWWIKISGETPR